ncbi:hypothetical protein P2318_28145 [Myxococcaceae bacterium GXIMD 01537]
MEPFRGQGCHLYPPRAAPKGSPPRQARGCHTPSLLLMGSARRRILDIIATDATFSRAEFRGPEVWIGACLHCNSHRVVER